MIASQPDFVERAFDTGNGSVNAQPSVRLNYAEGPPNGPPLVLLHGLGRRWQAFLPLIPALSLRWHIFAPDLRGHGKSSRVARGYRGDDYAADLANFLRERVTTPAVVFGHSLGGMAGMWLASHHPERVRALILGDNRIGIRSLHNPMYLALFSGLRDLSRRGGSLEQIAQEIGNIVLPTPSGDKSAAIREMPGNDESYLLAWAQCVQAADPDTYDMVIDGSALEGWDGEAMLRGIRCPVLLLQGAPELGGLMSDADVALAKRLLPSSAHIKFQNVGHALFLQQPDPVLQAVSNFLKSL